MSLKKFIEILKSMFTIKFILIFKIDSKVGRQPNLEKHKLKINSRNTDVTPAPTPNVIIT